MAAKPKAAAKAHKAPKKANKNPNFSAVQWKAYQAAARKAVRASQAQALRQRRLQAAGKATTKARAAATAARNARIKVHAVHQTYLQTVSGGQSKTLRVQAARRLFQVQSVATQKAFSARGQAIHAHTTRLQTVTSSQASSQQARFSASARKALAHKKPGTRKAAGRPSTGRSAAAGKVAGLAAARSTPAGPKVKSKPRKAALTRVRDPHFGNDWLVAGNDQGAENCTAVAVANHRLAWTGYRMTGEEIAALGTGSIRDVLKRAPGVTEMRPMRPVTGALIGYESEYGPHAGVLLARQRVVSWGESVPLEAYIEEAWFVRWRQSSKFVRSWPGTSRTPAA